MTIQGTMRQKFGNWTFLNNLGYMVVILDTLVEKGAVALEGKCVLPAMILAKELNHSEPQFPSLQNGYNNPCIDLLGNNEFEPSLFSKPRKHQAPSCLRAFSCAVSYVCKPKSPGVHIPVCSCHLGLSSNITFLRGASPDYPAYSIILNCITFIFFALSII